MLDMEIIRFAAIECKMQMSGELSVWHMLQAWEYAQKNSWSSDESLHPEPRLPTVDDVLKIGSLVEPNVTLGKWRNVDVRVGWDVKLPWESVPAFMVDVMERLHKGELTNEAFIYQSLGVCHPFRDGNGRTHQILWNWLEGTLDNPTWHKDFWDDPRRTVGFGA